MSAPLHPETSGSNEMSSQRRLQSLAKASKKSAHGIHSCYTQKCLRVIAMERGPRASPGHPGIEIQALDLGG